MLFADLSIWIVFGAIAVVAGIVAVIVSSVRYDRRRTEELQALAGELGLTFAHLPGPDLMASLGRFHLFSQGRSRSISNAMQGQSNEVEASILDYRYTTGGGKNSHTWKQTVIAFQASALRLPQFVLRAENVFDKLGAVVGFDDIDFEAYPEFSRAYFLKGADREGVRHAFHAGVLDALTALCRDSKIRTSLEADGDRLIFYRPSSRMPAAEVRGFLEQCFAIYREFCAEQAAVEEQPPAHDSLPEE